MASHRYYIYFLLRSLVHQFSTTSHPPECFFMVNMQICVYSWNNNEQIVDIRRIVGYRHRHRHYDVTVIPRFHIVSFSVYDSNECHFYRHIALFCVLRAHVLGIGPNTCFEDGLRSTALNGNASNIYYFYDCNIVMPMCLFVYISFLTSFLLNK